MISTNSYARSSNKTVPLVRTLVYLIPLLVAVQATIFGSLGLSQLTGTFPIITIGQFSLRIEELLILLFFLVFSLGLSFIPKLRMRSLKKGRARIGWALALLIFGMAQASIQGFIKKSPHNLTDTRLFFIPLLYFVFALYGMRSIRLGHLSNFVLFSLVPVALLLQVSLFTPIENDINNVAHLFGGVYGSFSPALVMLILSCLSMVLIRFIYSMKNRVAYLLLTLFLIVGLLIRIYKPGWVGTVAILVFSALILVRDDERNHNRHLSGKRLTTAYLFLLMAIFLCVLYVQVYKPQVIADYKEDVVNRIMRYDAGGDYSGNRFKMIEGAVAEITKSPLIGSGTGWWYEYKYQDGEIRNIPDHLIVTWILTRGGIITLVPLIILICWYIRTGFRNCLEVKNPRLKPFVIACYISTLQMLIYSLFGDYYSFFEQQIFFWLFVAVVLVAPTHPDNVMFSNEKHIIRVPVS